jgi:hypothetical protein
MKHGSATTQLEAGRVAEAHKDGHEILPIVAPDALHVESGVFDAPVVDAPLHTTTLPQEFDEWEGTEEDDVSQMVGVLSVQDAAQDAVFDGTGCDGGEPTDDAGAFWAWAMARTVERAMRENWTQDDMDAAYLQASLVSYQSHDSYPVIYGQGYVESDPEHFHFQLPGPVERLDTPIRVRAPLPRSQQRQKTVGRRLEPYSSPPDPHGLPRQWSHCLCLCGG